MQSITMEGRLVGEHNTNALLLDSTNSKISIVSYWCACDATSRGICPLERPLYDSKANTIPAVNQRATSGEEDEP